MLKKWGIKYAGESNSLRAIGRTLLGTLISSVRKATRRMLYGAKTIAGRKIPVDLLPVRFLAALVGLLFLSACDDMTDKTPAGGELPDNATSSRLYILSEGLIHLNNSTLALYDFETRTTATDWFGTVNGRKLGDTANDMGIYGTKLYLVVSTSGLVEVVDKLTGRSLKQIAMKDGIGRSREPRNIAFSDGFAYVCSFDGTVAEIDTATLSITRITTAGRNPDGITVAGGNLYVSNSGGLSFPNYDSTVSVIDPVTFKEIRKIEVGANPFTLQADSRGQLYVVTRGNYGNERYQLHHIDTRTHQYLGTIEGAHPLNFTLSNDTLWMYSFDHSTGDSEFQTYDTRSGALSTSGFIDPALLKTPFGITRNGSNGELFITDAGSYTTRGDVLCFSRDGKLKYRLKGVGVNPKKVVVE